jgi:hypothetical protein
LRHAIDSPPRSADVRLRALLLGEASLLEYRRARYAEAEARAIAKPGSARPR